MLKQQKYNEKVDVYAFGKSLVFITHASDASGSTAVSVQHYHDMGV
eukprot:SAG31_NODE_38598_length_295_cov_0.719388_1_plen_46_part_00